MPDAFDVQRELDQAAARAEEEARGLLEESEEKARERVGRLIPLGQDHYFDPLDRIVLLKVGKRFRNLGHNAVYLEIAAEKIEEQAREQGFTPVAGGLFWNPQTKHLYVKQADRYVLYSLDHQAPSGGD